MLPWKDTPRHRRFLNTLADSLEETHRKGIRLADIKTCNIFVSPSPFPLPPWEGEEQGEGGSWRFYLTDLDGTRFRKKLRPYDRLRNLLQLNCSTPRGVPDRWRMRFFKRYAIGMKRGTARWLSRGVANLSKQERILYVGLKGDVSESF
jgi:hypothetical protein